MNEQRTAFTCQVKILQQKRKDVKKIKEINKEDQKNSKADGEFKHNDEYSEEDITKYRASCQVKKDDSERGYSSKQGHQQQVTFHMMSCSKEWSLIRITRKWCQFV